ncbi:MAG: hypothetical protein ACRC7N_19620 [Clostridium sp.]
MKLNPNIDKAFHILETMSHDEKARAEYLAREMALHDEATRIEEAMEEGREEGRVLGLAEGRAKGAHEGIKLAKKVIRLFDNGTPIEVISKECNISVDMIKEIIE